MEPPSKRRRLLHRAALRQAHGRSADAQEPETNIAPFNQDKRHGREAHLPQAGPHRILDDLKQPDSLKGKIQKVHPRQLAPSSVSQVAHPMTTAVESVVRVIIDNPSGTAVGDVLVPAQSSVFTFDGYGSVTLPSNTGSPTSPPQPPARFESASASTTPGPPQSEVPQPTQQPTPMVTDQSSSHPSGASTTNVSTSTNSQANQSPMTINVAGSSSQVVLASPPATPVPSSPSSSILSTSASSTGSTTSYFSLPSGISSATISSQTSASPTPIQPPTSINTPVPTSGNFSMTSFTSSETSTGSKGPTSLTFANPISNSSSIASSTSSSSSSSSSGIISTTSSRGTSTTADSSSTMSTSSTFDPSTISSSSATRTSSDATSSTPGAGIIPGGVGGPSGSPTGTAPSSTSSSGSGSSDSTTPSTPTVVGGVVGGVAGLTIVLLLVLILFRWRRRKSTRARDISPPMAQTLPPTGSVPSGTVTERSSNVPLAAAGFFKRARPRSSATAATTETGPSERGFQNFGGRKLESVLSSGGDGWSNPGPSSSSGLSPRPVRGPGPTLAAGLAAGVRPASPETPLSETSFYRDSQGFYGGVAEAEIGSNTSIYPRPDSPPPRSPNRPAPTFTGASPLTRVGSQAKRDSEVAFMRPGPARTPVTNQPGFSSLRPSTGRGTPPPRPLPPVGASPTARDGVGRSHPSFDGSRGSRFTEEMAPP